MDKLPASRRQIAVLALCAVRLCLAEEEGGGEEGDGGGHLAAAIALLVLGLGCAVAVLCWVGAAAGEWIWREFEEGADRTRSSGDAPSSIELRAIEQVCVFNAHVCVCVQARECTRANTKCACVCARTHTHPAYTTRPVFVQRVRGRIVMNVLCGTGHSPPARARTCLGSVHWCCCCPDCRLRETGSKEGCGRSGRWLGAGV